MEKWIETDEFGKGSGVTEEHVKELISKHNEDINSHDSTLITVETLQDRDSIVNKVNGRVVRVNDVDGNGTSKYFRWDSNNHVWITESFGTFSGQVEISQVNGLSEKLNQYDSSMSWNQLE